MNEWMQVVSCFSALYKKIYGFSKLKAVKLPTRSLDSSYAKYGDPHFHTEHRLNRLSHEYNKTWLPLVTLSVYALKLPPHHGRSQNWHFTIMTVVWCTGKGWSTGLDISTLIALRRRRRCSSLKCAHAFQCEGLQNNRTSPKKEEGYWPFCVEYEIICCLAILKKYMQ